MLTSPRLPLALGLGLFLAWMLPWGMLVPRAETPAPQGATETAIVAGGCFWCVESDFDKVPGVIATVSGYDGGSEPNPTYAQVSSGATSHLEVVRITYDPSKVTYAQILYHFFRTVDPLDAGGQFCDRGRHYRTAILTLNDAQARVAAEAKAAAEAKLGQPVVTEITPSTGFTEAEGYHQDYYQVNPLRYSTYRYACGRDARVQAVWGDEAGGLTAKTE